MATLPGFLVETPVYSSGTKGRFVTLSGFGAEIGVTGTIITVYYKKRARDSGSVSLQYVIWVTTDKDEAYPDPPPFGGPLVEETIISTWQEIT